MQSWRAITETVREKKGKIFLQLWYSDITKRMTNITQGDNRDAIIKYGVDLVSFNNLFI